jgi:antitoxin component YwqK of YwqJK toxin-antitoxin module
MSPRFLTASALVTLLGCPPPEDTEKPDDTGIEETDTPDTWEEGCITVDGQGGYAWLNDAIHLAEEGATIEVCEGSFLEAVVVDKAVHIVGAGVDLTSFDAPQGEAPFTFQGVTGASLSGMSIASSRSAVELEASAEVVLSDLAFDTIANYAIDAGGCTGLEIAGSSFVASQWGAVRISGGDATISGSSFTDNLGFAIKGNAGAELSIQGNTISGTMYTELTEEKTIEDGFAVFLDEAGPATLSENVFVDNPILSVWAIEGDGLSMSGDSISGGLYGIYAIYGDLDLLDVTITDPTEMGVLYVANTGEALTAEGLDISGDPELVSDYDWDEGIVSSIGLYVEGSDITLSGCEISGYNSYGAFLLGNSDTDGSLVLEDVTFDGNGRRGIFSSDLDATATGLTIRNLRELDEDYGGAIYIDLPAAWYHQSGDLQIDGALFSNNQGWGLSAAQANTTLTNSTLEANGRAGFIDYAGTSNVTNNSFTGSLDASNFGALCAYQSNGMLVQGNTFGGNAQWEKTRVYEDAHGNKTVYVYHDEVYDLGLDLYAYEATVDVIENSFEDGYLGAQIYSSDGELRGNSFAGYAYAAIYVGGEGSDAVRIEDNTVTGGIGYGLMISSADVEVQQLEVSDGRSELISYDYYYNGDLIFSSSYNTSYDAVYLSNSRALLEDVTIDSPAGEGLYSYNSTVELDTVTIRNASSATSSSYGAYFYHYDSPPEIHVDGLTIEEPQGSGAIYLYTYATKSFVAAEFDDVTITDPAGNGIVMSSFASNEEEQARFTQLEITGAGGAAVSMSSSSASFTDAVLQGAAGAGITASSSSVELWNTLVEGNGGDGLYASSSAVTVDGCEIVTNTGDGLELIASSASLDSSTITSNEGWGISCSSVGFDSCSDNTLSGNTLGDNNGCDASCGGTGGSDTGL